MRSTQKLEQIQALLGRGNGRDDAPNGASAERVRKWMLHFNLDHLHGPEEIEYGPDELVVVCLVRNGRPYVESFVRHYRELGVKHMVFLDNGSADGTLEALQSYDHVTVLHTELPFKRYQMAVKQYLMERFCRDRWSLCVDIDELFDYPYSDVVDLGSLLDYLTQKSYTALAAQMLDMFSEEPLSDIVIDGENESLKETYGFYDTSNVRRQDYLESPLAGATGNVPANAEVSVFRGGVQKSVFGSLALLTKHPLVFIDDKVIPMDGSAHAVSNARIADVSCVLFHYKFTKRLYEQVRRAVQQENYMKDSLKHKKHSEVLEKTPLLQLKDQTARELGSVNDLVHNGFLAVSSDYMKLVDNEERGNIVQEAPQKLVEAFLATQKELASQSLANERRIQYLQTSLIRQERRMQRLEERGRRLDKRNRKLTKQARSLRQQLESIRSSTSWRLLVGLGHVSARLLGRK